MATRNICIWSLDWARPGWWSSTSINKISIIVLPFSMPCSRQNSTLIWRISHRFKKCYPECHSGRMAESTVTNRYIVPDRMRPSHTGSLNLFKPRDVCNLASILSTWSVASKIPSSNWPKFQLQGALEDTVPLHIAPWSFKTYSSRSFSLSK